MSTPVKWLVDFEMRAHTRTHTHTHARARACTHSLLTSLLMNTRMAKEWNNLNFMKTIKKIFVSNEPCFLLSICCHFVDVIVHTHTCAHTRARAHKLYVFVCVFSPYVSKQWHYYKFWIERTIQLLIWSNLLCYTWLIFTLIYLDKQSVSVVVPWVLFNFIHNGISFIIEKPRLNIHWFVCCSYLAHQQAAFIGSDHSVISV